MNAYQRIQECIRLLEQHDTVLSDCVAKGGQQNHPQAIAFQRSFRFIIDTMNSILLVLRDRHDVLSSITLCRPCYELALRILWASRAPDGWQRFQAYWANEDKKWATEANKVSSAGNVVREVLGFAEAVLARRDSAGKCYPPMPSTIPTILCDIEKKDKEEGLLDEQKSTKEYEYANVYRMLCRPAHGNVFPVGTTQPSPKLEHLITGVALATFALVRATIFVAARDEKGEIEAVGQRIVTIITGSDAIELIDSPNGREADLFSPKKAEPM